MDTTHLPLLLLLIFCTLFTVVALLSHLPFLRRLNRDMWRFLLASMGKKQGLELAVRVLDSWTAWLGFTWGLSLLPLCLALFADIFLPISGDFCYGYSPLVAVLSILLILFFSLICTLVAFIRWLCLRGRDESHDSTLPPLP